MLQQLGLGDAELSVRLTNDSLIRKLNCEYRGQDRPTDVLAFPLDAPSGKRTTESMPRLLGDVVISIDTARRQARARGHQLIEEVRWLLAHGLLHLVGHDHATAPAKRKMEATTRRLVRATTAATPRARAGGVGQRTRPRPQ